MKFTTYQLIMIAQSAIIICIFSKISFPIGTVPITGQTLAIGLISALLRPSMAIMSVLLYLLLGLIGLPVFAGATAGIAAFISPTGGFLLGFIFYAGVTSFLIKKMKNSFYLFFIANIIGTLIAMLSGSIILSLYNHISLMKGMMLGFIPFIIPEIMKALLSSYLGLLILKKLPKKFL